MDASSIQVCKDLIGLIKRTKLKLGALAEKHGLTHMQLYVLESIQRSETTMSRLAGNLQCDASNITGIVDRLVVLGLITRQEDEHDRRTRVLHLTAKGQNIFDQLSKELPEALGCTKLAPADKQVLHEIINKLA